MIFELSKSQRRLLRIAAVGAIAALIYYVLEDTMKAWLDA